MKNKTYSIDHAMVTRKFYCHKCGGRLVRNARSRLLRRGDPDYRKYNMNFIGDVEHTEYDFKCLTCDRIIDRKEQYVIERIQKKLDKHTLSEAEIAKNEENARAAIARKGKIGNIIVTTIFVVSILVTFYFCLK